MTLSEILEALGEDEPYRSAWRAAVLTRRRWDNLPSEEILEFPIFGVEVDEEAEEIDLLTDQGASAPRTWEHGLTAGDLLRRLQSIDAGVLHYRLFSASAKVEVHEYLMRKDVPLVGIALNAEDAVFGLLQGPPEAWDELRSVVELQKKPSSVAATMSDSVESFPLKSSG